jgi:hypothetical protein
MDEATQKTEILFILSSERSGSTLLTRMLAQNAHFISPPELWFLRYQSYEGWKKHKPEAFQSLEVLASELCPPQTGESLDRKLKGMLSIDVYEALLGMCEQGRVLVDKTPGYANEFRVLNKTLSLNARYVWLLRHPLGVIDSEMRHMDKRLLATGKNTKFHRMKLYMQSLLDRGMTRRARRREEKWRRQNANIEKFLQTVPESQHTTVYFENLLQQPEDNLRRVCEVLQVDYLPEMKNPFLKNVEIQAGIGNPNFNQRTSVDSNLASEWKDRYSLNQLNPATLSLMKKIGMNV